MATSQRVPAVAVRHAVGAARATATIAAWESLTTVNLAAVTTVDADSTGTTLNVASTTCFNECTLGTSQIMVAGQTLTINGVTSGVSLTVSAISGTISSGQAISCGFIGEGYADATFDEQVTFAGASGVSATYFRVLMPAVGQEHGLLASAGCLVDCVTAAATLSATLFVLKVREDYFGLYGMVVTSSAMNVNAHTGMIIVYNCVFPKIVGNIIPTTLNAYAGKESQGIYLYRLTGGTSGYVVDNLIYEVGYGVHINSSASGYFYNNTLVDCRVACGLRTSGTAYLTNGVYAANLTGAWTLLTNVYQASVTFANYAGKDFHLAVGDTGARGAATDLSGTGAYLFTDDGELDPRTAWDIGADEYVASGTTYQGTVTEGVVAGDSWVLFSFAPSATNSAYYYSAGSYDASGNTITINGPYNAMPAIGFVSTLPGNATIVSAVLNLVSLSNSYTTTPSSIRLYMSADAFPATGGAFTSMTLTTAYTTWAIESWDTTDKTYSSDDVSAVLQEVIDAGGYALGDSFVVMGNTPSGGERGAYGVNYAAHKPTMTVVYSLPGPYGTAVYSTVVLEAADMSDTPVGRADYSPALTEGVVGSDTLDGTALYQGVLAEGVEASDMPVGSILFTVNVTDGVNASDAVTGNWTTQGAVSEGITATDRIYLSAEGALIVTFASLALDATLTSVAPDTTFTAQAPTTTLSPLTATITMTGHPVEE